MDERLLANFVDGDGFERLALQQAEKRLIQIFLVRSVRISS